MATITKEELKLVVDFCKLMFSSINTINSVADVYAIIVLLAQFVKHLVYIDNGDTVSVGIGVLKREGASDLYKSLLSLRNSTEHPINIHDMSNKVGAFVNVLNTIDLSAVEDDDVSRLCMLLKQSEYLLEFKRMVLGLYEKVLHETNSSKTSLGSLFSKATGDK